MDDWICDECFARVPLECSQLHVDWHAGISSVLAALASRTSEALP